MDIKYCKDCGVELIVGDTWYACLEKGRSYQCIQCNLEHNKQYKLQIKKIVLDYYGNGRCSCCGESNIEFLSIDHINGGGSQHRKENSAVRTIYSWLKKNNYPSGFRVLCHNCNQSLGFLGYCPHSKEMKGSQYKTIPMFAGMMEKY
jgi:hypothetical protein